jgi:hypothetical protein
MQLEDITLNEVSQDQKHKRHIFSHMWKIGHISDLLSRIDTWVFFTAVSSQNQLYSDNHIVEAWQVLCH